jgi:hypothetical protein
MRSKIDRRTFLASVILSGTLAGCAALEEIAALRSVEFSLAGTSGATLAGVPLDSVRSIDQLSSTQIARVGAALAQGRLPLEANLLVRAINPADNVQARLTRLDWTLFLDDQETINGVLDREFVLPPGEPATVPVQVRLDLLDFFADGRLEQVVNLALALAGAEGARQRVRLQASPSIQTPVGPIRYPRPISIEYEVMRP